MEQRGPTPFWASPVVYASPDDQMHKTQIRHKKNICRTLTRETLRLVFSQICYWGKWTIASNKSLMVDSHRRGEG